MASSVPGPSTGPLAAAIPDAVAQLLRERTGRGPTNTRTTLDENLVVSVLHDTLTAGERALVAGGKTELVLSVRREHQRLMQTALVATIEGLTGRHVSAFLNDSHVDPDVAVEVFVLAPRTGSNAGAG
jgi:uncharacterized protein YbcI